jgi:hypothetical protein
MPFGVHKGQPISCVPQDYLHWLTTIDLREPLRGAVLSELRRRDQMHAEDEDQHRWSAYRSGVAPDRRTALQIVRTGFRACTKAAHPDAGGEHRSMVALNQANDWLLQQIEVLA